MPNTTMPDAITNLIALITAAVTPVQVIDGPIPPGTLIEDEHVHVGTSEDLGGLALVGEHRWAALGAGRQNETFDVLCRIRVRSNLEDQAAVRARVFAIFALIEAAVVASTSLAPAGTSLLPPQIAGALELDQTLPTEDVDTASGVETRITGRAARLTFPVHCQHRI